MRYTEPVIYRRRFGNGVTAAVAAATTRAASGHLQLGPRLPHVHSAHRDETRVGPVGGGAAEDEDGSLRP